VSPVLLFTVGSRSIQPRRFPSMGGER
jgi:hypothetical protein